MKYLESMLLVNKKAIRCGDGLKECLGGDVGLDAQVEAFSEVVGNFGVKEFFDGAFDIVSESVEGEGMRLGIEDGAAGAVVAVAGLADAADGNEIFFTFFEVERIAGDIGCVVGRKLKGLREVGVTDECNGRQDFVGGEEL